MVLLRRCLLVAIILASAQAFAANGQVTESVLPNGLKVLVKEVHSAPVVTTQVWYKVGSRNEHTGITGVSHLVEHMMFKGTKAHGKGEYSRLIESKGGTENAATWIDYTYYWSLMSSENLELAISLEADRMNGELFDPKEFSSERIVVRSELEGRENDPDTLLYQAVQATAYKVHPYRWPTIGWVSDVEGVSRDQVYNYYKTYYHPNNATLVVVGDVDPQRVISLAREYFGGIPRGVSAPTVYTKEPVQDGERRFTIRHAGTAERVTIAYHVPESTSPDTYALMVLDQVLSGGKSSRLYQKLVEGQLATTAWSSESDRKDPGLFMLGATAREGVTASKLEKSLLEEVEKIKSAPPSDQEMSRAKNQLEAYLVFQNDSMSDQGEQLGYYETISSWTYLNTLLPKIKEVTAADVQRVAKTYLTEDNRTVGWFVPSGAPAGGQETGGPPEALHFKDSRDMAPHHTGAAKFAQELAQAPPMQSKPTSTRIKPTRTVLDNGMVVIVQENHSNPTVAARGYLMAGGYFDPMGKKGLASFTSEMLTRGTTKRSALDIANQTDFVGASADTSADTEAARFSGKGLSKNFDLLMDILSDELRNPSFPQDQIDRLKGQMISNLDQEKEDPGASAERAFNRAIFPEGHPYRPQTVEDAQAGIKSFTRDEMVNFHKTYYGPETTVIVIVGDVTTEQAVATVKKFFGDWKPTGAPRKVTIPDVRLPDHGTTEVIDMPDKSQVNVVFGYPGQLSRLNPDYYSAVVMNYILGGAGLESLLGKKVREDLGLVYFVYSYFDATLGAGPWMGGFGSNPANADKAIAATNQTINDYLTRGPSQKEVTQAIDYIVGSFPVRLETNDGVANVLSSSEFYGLGLDYIDRYAKIYRSITLDQAKAAARKYLHPASQTVVIAGPYKKK